MLEDDKCSREKVKPCSNEEGVKGCHIQQPKRVEPSLSQDFKEGLVE